MPVSIDIHNASDLVQRLRETCHDMRQPLASVFALAAATLAEPGLAAAARERLEHIVGQAEWLSSMTDQFLRDTQQEDPDGAGWTDLGETGAMDSRPDVVPIVKDVIEAGRLIWPCEVTVGTDAAPLRCTLPPALLRRIVSNVLDNAVRAAGPSGIVTVEIGRCAGLVMLVVEDSGPGFGNIPSGAGLGLSSVARSIVKHGGRVECGRRAGGGARIVLWLP